MMLYGTNPQGERITPSPKARSFCPMCGTELIAKCGKVMTWHWAHRSDECDPFHEPETEWHRKWKKEFPTAQVEKVIKKLNSVHKADVLTERGLVIEFQHSPLPVEDIYDREAFYGDMVWIFDAAKPFLEDRLRLKLSNSGKSDQYGFFWSHARKTIWQTQKPVYFDLGDGRLLLVRRFYEGEPGGPSQYDESRGGWYSPGSKPWGGWGILITKDQFIKMML